MVIETVPFSINVVGDTSGELFRGDFEAKPRLSHRDELFRDRIRRQHLGQDPQFASPRAINQAAVFANLDVRLTKWPKWWSEVGNGLDLADDNVLAAVMDECLRIEKEAQEKTRKRALDAQAALKKMVEETDSKD